MDDISRAKPLDLLARYRLICENVGACRATDTQLPRELREQLASVEAELQSRLWLASEENTGQARTPRPERVAPSATRAPRDPEGPEPSPEHRSGSTPGRGKPDGPIDFDLAPLVAPAPRTKKSAGPIDFDRAPLTPSTAATVYCDGACQGNPGPGGYGVVVRVPGHPERTLADGKTRTTNNEMELSAAAAGLRLAVDLGAKEIAVVTDSEYLVKGMSGWVKGWLRNGWKTSKGEPVKNRALWEELHALCQGRKVTWSWIRGHNGHPENERCDAMAVAAARAAAVNGRR